MSLTLEEFLRFADSVSEVLPGFEGFAERARRYPVVVEQFLPAIEVRLKERAEQYRKMGLVVPEQMGGASSGTPGASGVESPDREEILGALLGVISEKTGYETEELDVDYELEADLGIDTVKQAEIFGEVRERYGLAPDAEFRLADYPTIAKLAGWLFDQMEAGGGAGTSESVNEQPELLAVEDSADEEASVESPLDEAPASTNQEIRPPVIEPRLDAAVAAEVREVETPSDFTLPPDFRIRRPIWVDCPLPQGESYREQRIEGRVRILGTGPVVDRLREELTARGATVVDEADDIDSVVDLGAGVMDAFDLAQQLDGDPPVQWVSAQLRPTGLLDEVLVDAGRSGARAGFAKAVAREWTARSEVEQGVQPCRAKVIDLAADLPADRAAALLCDEIAAPDGAWEVQRDEDRRRVLQLRVEQFPVPDQPLEGQPVFVLTGGTRGITALVARDLARRGPCRLALFARTAPAVDPLDEKAAKAEIRAGLDAEGVRATPVRIQQKLRRLLSADEARQNVEAMRKLGAEVHFFQVDLSDPRAVGEALDAVGELLGDVHAVIHGAGIEESRPLGSKDHDAFQRVFGGKAGGGLALVRHLEPGTKFVSMGSVAGRFGNAGQVDYSAANDAMARVCIVRPNSLHVDWTAWADVGMAVRGGMEKLLTDRGVQMLPSDQGASLLVDMMLSGISGEVMVAGRLGGFATAPSHPLLDSVDWEGDAVVVTHEFTGESDPWLDDHTIDGTRVLPGVVGLEMMVAAARLVHPDKAYAGAREVSYQSPVKLHSGQSLSVRIRAEPLTARQVRCRLSSHRVARTGRVLDVDHFSALVELGEAVVPQPLPPASYFPEEGLSKEGIYQRFFHGPAFQVLHEAWAIGAMGINADAQVFHGVIAAGLVTAPLILEAAFQAAGLHRMATDGVMALPESIGQVRMLGTVEDGAQLQISVQNNAEGYDIDIHSGQVGVMMVRGFRMAELGPLPDGDRIPVPDGGWPEAVIALAATGQGTHTVTPGELAEIRSRGSARRVSDRLVGRVAAKRAVSVLTGLGHQEFVIRNDDRGRPLVRRSDGGSAPVVSLSHRAGRAVAVASWEGAVGIDLEQVEERHPSFARTWFREREQRLCRGDPRRETATWAIKEAVLKALGRGLALDPRDVEVLTLDSFVADIVLHGQARDLHRDTELAPFVVHLQHEADAVMVFARAEVLDRVA